MRKDGSVVALRWWSFSSQIQKTIIFQFLSYFYLYIASQAKDEPFAAFSQKRSKLSFKVVGILTGSRRYILFGEGLPFGGADGGGDVRFGVGQVVKFIVVGLCLGSAPSLGAGEGKLLFGGGGVERVDQHSFGVHEFVLEGSQFAPRAHLIILFTIIAD